MKKIFFILIIFVSHYIVAFAGSTVTFVARVVDEKGNPVVGAYVSQESNASINTLTDDHGKFILNVDDGESVRISLVNGDYIIVPSDNDGDIVFDQTSKAVEYGFNIGYNLLESTASVNTVYAEDLEKFNALDPTNSLYGVLPGLAAMQSGGTPWDGGSGSFFIRGKGTYKNSNILVLVDGIERPFESLAMEDIESISVIKDAAALALYGQRGANGILYVKTKRGYWKGNEVKIEYSHGFTSPRNLPDMVNGYNYALAVNEGLFNDGLDAKFSEYDIVDIANGTYPYVLPDVDWVKESLRNMGSQDNVNVSYRGGNKTVAYYALLNYSNEKGIYGPTRLNDGYSTQLNRHDFNVSTKLDVHVTKSTTLSVNLTANIAQYTRPGGPMHNDIFSTFYTLPATVMPVRAEDGTWGGNPLYMTDGVSANPVAQIAGRGYINNHGRRLAVDGTLRQDLGMLVKGLSADLRVGYDNAAEFGDKKTIPSFRYSVYSYYRDPVSHNIPAENILTEVYGNEALIKTSRSFNWQNRHGIFQGKVNYNLNRGKHSFYANAGFFQEKTIKDSQYNTFLHQNILAQAHYSFDRRFVADLAMSYSGTNYMAPGDRFRFFPSVSAAWIISNEHFLKGSNVNLLKLRASYGLAGNGNIAQNLFTQGFTYGAGYPFKNENTNQNGRTEGKMPTSYITPERSHTANFGVDFSFWNKLSGTVDFFYSRRTDILADSGNTVSMILGVEAPMICTGIVDNAGFETGLQWNDRIGDFSYNIGAQFSFARNKIINQEEAYTPYDYLKSTGRRVGQPFGLVSDGFFQNQAEIDAALPQDWGALRPGDVRYKDQNGDNKIDKEDVVAFSSPSGYPGMYFSCSLGFEWKGLGFNALFQGAADYSVNLNTQGVYKGLIDNTTISNYMYENAWSALRDTPAKYPRLTTLKNDNNYRNNDIWIQDNPFLKLRYVNVYYRFPDRWLSKIKIRDLRLYLNGSNLFSIDKLEVQDPEYLGTGYPLMSIYTLGLSFKF